MARSAVSLKPREEFVKTSERSWSEILREGQYLADEALALMLGLAIDLQRPLLLEGPSGSGKTALAEAAAKGLGVPLIRLSCYEGLGPHEALYDWNYHLQWVRMATNEGVDPFSDEFLLARPLLKALQQPRSVLLIDEVDRADEAFEALLLEFLSEYQISIPERGIVRASNPPVVILTSNRQRPLSDALRRRCLYALVEWPELAREIEIVRFHVPELSEHMIRRVVCTVRTLRTWDLVKPPGLSETIDWAKATALRRVGEWTRDWLGQSLGLVIKDALDMAQVTERLEELVKEAT